LQTRINNIRSEKDRIILEKTEMKPHIGITDKNLKNSIELLSTTLADAMTYTKTKKISLNVTGESLWKYTNF
jgi:hypothetical protein